MTEEHKTDIGTQGRRGDVVGERTPMGRNRWKRSHRCITELVKKLEGTEGRTDRKWELEQNGKKIRTYA